MSEGKVLAAAKTKGLDSLTKVANALIHLRPDLFKGIAARSLGAKLSELNRENITWWRNRMDCLEALQDLLGLDSSDLIAAKQARQRGLWVCGEFPELPALNLASETIPTLAEPVVTGAESQFPPRLNGWLLVGVGSDYAQHPKIRPEPGLQWLHVPQGTGRNLLLSRIKALGRLDVSEGHTLRQAVAQASRSRPVVLAPLGITAVSELGALAEFDVEQPVLIISANPCPRTSKNTPYNKSNLPSWEWLWARRSERVRTVFAANSADMHSGIFGSDSVVEFRLELLPNWREKMLFWVEERLKKHVNTLFTAEGLNNWLAAFDPDGVFFPTPATVLSLARICHEVGERQLPNPGSSEAGMQLVQKLGRADSRYQSLLVRLVRHSWLDTNASWQKAKPWHNWLAPSKPSANPESNKTAGRRTRPAGASAIGTDAALLTENDLDAAVKAGLLIPNGDGNYGFKSYAEAALVLRDQLRGWMRGGELSNWGAQVVSDGERQQLVDEVLKTLDNQTLLGMCSQVAKLPLWSAEALGASETLFLAVGLRMAEDTLSYRAEFGELMGQTLARCFNDDAYLQLPLSRSLCNDAERIDWVRATWGWSIVAPKPEWVPASMSDSFPGWSTGEVEWLFLLPIPVKGTSLQTPHLRRLAAAINTAAVVADRVGCAQNWAPEVLVAVIGLLRTVRGSEHVQPAWWESIAQEAWPCDVLGAALVNLRPDIQRDLASSLVEVCAKIIGTNANWGVLRLVRSPLWLQILDVKDAAELFARLKPIAMVFVAQNIQSVPWSLRKAIVDKIDPELLPDDFDWHSLLCATTAPNKERIDQFLSCRPYQCADSLWKVYPDLCLEWATDPDNQHHAILIDQCPPHKLGEMAAVLVQTPVLVNELNIQPRWVASRIAGAKASTPVLLELLSLALSSNPSE